MRLVCRHAPGTKARQLGGMWVARLITTSWPWTARRTAVGSKRSTSRAVAPARSRAACLSGVRPSAVTRCPAATSSGTTLRPMTPVAPVRKIEWPLILLPSCNVLVKRAGARSLPARAVPRRAAGPGRHVLEEVASVARQRARQRRGVLALGEHRPRHPQVGFELACVELHREARVDAVALLLEHDPLRPAQRAPQVVQGEMEVVLDLGGWGVAPQRQPDLVARAPSWVTQEIEQQLARLGVAPGSVGESLSVHRDLQRAEGVDPQDRRAGWARCRPRLAHHRLG